MNLQKIRRHRECCHLLIKTGLAKELTEQCMEQDILAGGRRIIETGVSQQMQKLEKDVQRRLLNNPELLEYTIKLFQKGADAARCNSIMGEIELEVLLGYDIDRVMDILSDCVISNKFLVVYLKYYGKERLTDVEKSSLMYGLENYFSKRKCKDDKIFLKNSRLFCSDFVSSSLLTNLQDYDACLAKIANNKTVCRVLHIIYEMGGWYMEIDDEAFRQVEKDPLKIAEGLSWAEQFFEESEKKPFIKLLVNNHALLYDLGRLRTKVESGRDQEAHQMVKDRIAYISFLYSNQYIDLWRGAYMEELIIFAISHKKKAFLLLIQENKEIFTSLPRNSVLFQTEFYSHIVNINTLNKRNLKQCNRIQSCTSDFLKLFYDKGCTFEEFAILSEVSIEYARLYFLLQIPRIDDRLRVIREVIRKRCLSIGMNLPAIAEQLSVRPLSQWMQKNFSNIDGLDSKIGIKILENYERIKHLTSDIRTIAEARYVTSHAKNFQTKKDMKTVRDSVLQESRDWINLQKNFQFSPEFIQENEERIRNFIFEDGAYIMWTYLQQMQEKTEELRRLVFAELSGRFRELKYFGNDLERELDYPIMELSKNMWKKNLLEEKDGLCVWEEDGLIPVMRMGEVPYATCLSYKTGIYKECLLACHDSNKKILNLSLNGKIVLRAAIRMTKGYYGKARKMDTDLPQLEFADLSEAKVEKKQDEKKEQLVLFLERAYIAGLPENLEKSAIELILSLMNRKARQLKAKLVASNFYSKWKTEEMCNAVFSIYISKSKAGSKYLDSLDGSKSVINEGTYQSHIFLILGKK